MHYSNSLSLDIIAITPLNFAYPCQTAKSKNSSYPS